MKNMQLVSRIWSIAVPESAIDSSPLAKEHAEQLVDIYVAGSVQSLKETREALHKLEQDFMQKMSEYEHRSKLINRRADKTKFEAYGEMLAILFEHLSLYEQRIEANKQNNGRVGD